MPITSQRKRCEIKAFLSKLKSATICNRHLNCLVQGQVNGTGLGPLHLYPLRTNRVGITQRVGRIDRERIGTSQSLRTFLLKNSVDLTISLLLVAQRRATGQQESNQCGDKPGPKILDPQFQTFQMKTDETQFTNSLNFKFSHGHRWQTAPTPILFNSGC